MRYQAPTRDEDDTACLQRREATRTTAERYSARTNTLKLAPCTKAPRVCRASDERERRGRSPTGDIRNAILS